MFKVAPRYLSGVSVFYGDDITRREVAGEIAFILGQAKKGVKVPLVLNSPDNAFPVYGTDSSLTKALFQFADGFADSPRATPIRFVTMRIGGISAKLVTSFGVTIETVDAYDGIEDKYYVFINDNLTPRVKVWNENKALVYDSTDLVDTGDVVVTYSNATATKPSGISGKTYGVDITSNSLTTPVTLSQLQYLDKINPAEVNKFTDLLSISTKPVVTNSTIIHTTDHNTTLSNIPATGGTISLTATVGTYTETVTYGYSSYDYSTRTFTLSSAIAATPFASASIAAADIVLSIIGSTFTSGDSELTLTSREKYEYYKNALAEIEQFIPDYIIPGGILADETVEYDKLISRATALGIRTGNSGTILQDGTSGAFVIVSAASDWPTSGTITINDGTFLNEVAYTSITTKTDSIPNVSFVASGSPRSIANSGTLASTGIIIDGSYSSRTGVVVVDIGNAKFGTVAGVTGIVKDNNATPGYYKYTVTPGTDEATLTLTFVSGQNNLGSMLVADLLDICTSNTIFTSGYQVNVSVPSTTFKVTAQGTAITGGVTGIHIQASSGNGLTTLQSLELYGVFEYTTGAIRYEIPYTVTGITGTDSNAYATVNVYVKGTADQAKLNAFNVIDQTATKILGTFIADVNEVGTSWQEAAIHELGLGYVKETLVDGQFTFDWQDEKLTEEYFAANFPYMFAKFCNDAAVEYNTPIFAMNTSLPVTYDRAGINTWIGKFPTYKLVPGSTTVYEDVTVSGTGLLGNTVLAGSKDYNRSILNDSATATYVDPAYGLLLTEEGFIDGTLLRDTYGKLVDLGKFGIFGAGIMTFNNMGATNTYYDTCGIYACGLLAGKPKNEGLSFSPVGTASSAAVTVVVHRRIYNDLASLGYIVLTREKGLGWVVNNSNTPARDGSGYYLISTTRIVKTVVESKRAILTAFIGKPLTDFYYEAARTRLADAFKNDVGNGLLNGYSFDLQTSAASRAIGKLYLKVSLNPPLELVQVDIDTVIDRNVTTTG